MSPYHVRASKWTTIIGVFEEIEEEVRMACKACTFKSSFSFHLEFSPSLNIYFKTLFFQNVRFRFLTQFSATILSYSTASLAKNHS